MYYCALSLIMILLLLLLLVLLHNIYIYIYIYICDCYYRLLFIVRQILRKECANYSSNSMSELLKSLITID